MSYNIEGTFDFNGETFRSGDRVAVDSIDYGIDELAIVAGTMSATGGTMIVLEVEGEHTVLAVDDIRTLTKLS